jgi:hypothetical protein
MVRPEQRAFQMRILERAIGGFKFSTGDFAIVANQSVSGAKFGVR